MSLKYVITMILLFFLGFLSSTLISGIDLVSGQTQDMVSPSDRITEDQIHIYDDKVVLDVKNAQWARFADTNSMDPFLDSGSNALQLIPKNPEDISVGDIISYVPINSDSTIIHRVMYIGQDSDGIYYIVKGDNNKVSDPGKVRFEQIDRVLFGIIY